MTSSELPIADFRLPNADEHSTLGERQSAFNRFSRADWLIIAGLVLGTLLLYARVAHFDFINYDDDDYVYQNPHVRAGLSWAGVKWASTEMWSGNWHPLTWLSLMLDVSLFGLRPGAMHLVNVTIHSVSSALLFVFLLRTTGARWAAAWVAAMFAWHPLRVESVAWISERKDVLSTLFWMLTTLAYVGYVQRRSVARYLGTLALLELALLSKAMPVTLPCALLLLDCWPLKRCDTRSLWPWPSKLIVEKLPMFALVAISCVVMYRVQIVSQGVAAMSWAVRAGNVIVSYVQYLWMMLVPRGLGIYYPHPGTLADPPAMLVPSIACGAALLLVTIAVIGGRRARPWLVVGWLWYLGTLVPAVGLVQVGGQGMADRYTYIPGIGILIIVAWAAREFAPRRLVLIAGISSIVGASALTYPQLGFWQNAETLMRHTVEVVPRSYRAHLLLGQWLDTHGRRDEADEHYRSALRDNPLDSTALDHLAVHDAAAGRYDEALQKYDAVLRLAPDSPDPLVNYGNLLAKLGRIDEAERAYIKALGGAPHLAPALIGMGSIRAQRGQFDEASTLFRRAIAMDPNRAEAHHGLGLSLVVSAGGDAQRLHEGLAELRRALALDPTRIDTLTNLAWILATHADPAVQDGAEAVRLAESALHLSPTPNAQLLDTLAAARARAGRFEEAVESADRAAKLADDSGQSKLAERIRQRLQQYRSRQPYTSGK